ncbi:MAG: hypothetical protein WB493_14755, partial [Anaeromyxobacteraceae bacterium]
AKPAEPAAVAPADEPYPNFGLSLTLGAPDGAVLAFIYSPLYWVAVDVGFAYTLAPGFVIGLEFQPIDFIVFPIVRGEYGYYFAGNTANQIKTWAGVSPELAPLIGDASYNWWSALIGIGIGSRRGFSAKLEGGLTWLSLNVKGGSGSVNNVQVTLDPWRSQAFAPAARLSFQYFF